jgi:CubicO group peptidase (beta-lactamase class C family)
MGALALTPWTLRAAQADDWTALIDAELRRQQVPGAAVAVVRHDQPTWLHAAGFAHLDHEVPVRPQTIFQSGSLGKQFTAVAVLLLVQDGKLGLDDPLSRWWPVPASWRRITVRHLLTHTSGLAEDYPPERLNFQRDYSDAELLRIALRLPLASAPGTRWQYSNVGYVLLGLLLNRVAGRFYGELLQERVFAPLGMRSARIIDEGAIVPHRAAGYQWHPKTGLRQHDWVSPSLNRTADGAIYLSIEDLVAWDAGVRRGALLTPQLWQQAHRRARLNDGRQPDYGLGWFLDPDGTRRRIHHDGQWQGFTSWLGWYPDEGLSVAVLMNLAEGDPRKLGEMLAAAASARQAAG